MFSLSISYYYCSKMIHVITFFLSFSLTTIAVGWYMYLWFISIFYYIYNYTYISEYLNYFSACCFSTPPSEEFCFLSCKMRSVKGLRLTCTPYSKCGERKPLDYLCRLSSSKFKNILYMNMYIFLYVFINALHSCIHLI